MEFGLSFTQQLAPQLVLECALCDGTMNEHEERCPLPGLEMLRDKRLSVPCPACQKYAVDVNEGDLYECRDCSTQFTTGQHLAPSIDAQKLYLDVPGQDLVPVVQMTQLGEGKFPIDEQIKKAEEIVKAWKAERGL